MRFALLLIPIATSLNSRGQPLVTITIDAPSNSSSPSASGEVIHVTPVVAAEEFSTGSSSSAPSVEIPTLKVSSETGENSAEQVIRIELVNTEDWWSAEASQLHFPKELSVRLLLGFLGCTFLFGLGVSILMIIRWWQIHHAAATAKNSAQSADFHRILA
jgi:hypothetical protein